MFQLLNCDDQQSSFRDCQLLNGHSARKKEFSVNSVTRHRIVRTNPSCEVLETGGWQVIAKFFLDFAHDTTEKALVALPSTAEKPDLSWF